MVERIMCSCCGCEIDDENEVFYDVNGNVYCEDCYNSETVSCDWCHERFPCSDDHGDEEMCVCGRCYDNHFYHCTRCGRLVSDNDACWHDDDPYCDDCCPSDDDYSEYIHDYYYKPKPLFYKRNSEGDVRYYGVELEIDKGGKSDENAEKLYGIANSDDEVLYIKSDGSLDYGMELVSHPCSLEYHRQNMHWQKLMKKAAELGYRSHNTNTCGLHVHIGRAQLGKSYEEQEEVIGRIIFFFESHWNELVKFSRRTENSISRWAARYGYKDKPKELLENAKKSSSGRYVCVNITNSNTIEIRMFRGTLNTDTFIAALELVDLVCENAVRLTDEEIHKQSWNDFVMTASKDRSELITYLKNKRLYVNEPYDSSEEEI